MLLKILPRKGMEALWAPALQMLIWKTLAVGGYEATLVRPGP